MSEKRHDSSKAEIEKEGLKPATFFLIAIILILIWGTSYTMVSVAVRHIPPIWLVAGRTCLGAILVTLYAYWRGHRFPNIMDVRWRWYLVLGLIGMVIPFFLMSKGQLTVDSGITSILSGTMPLMTVILAHFFAGETLNLRKAVGFVIGFLGVCILFLPENLSLEIVSSWKGQSLIILAALFYAMTTVLAKRTPETPSSLGAAMMILMAGLVSLAAAVLSGIPKAPPPPIAFLMIFGLGIASTALGTILYLYVIKMNGPSALAKINYFPPITAVIAGIFLLGEPFSWRIVAAFVIIILGVTISRTRIKPAAVAGTPEA